MTLTKTKIIFLDIDGVLATVRQFNLNKGAKTYINEYDTYPFDKKCVKIFNEVLERTDAEIVLSSDWQYFYKKKEIDDIFKINEVIKSPIAFTSDLKTKGKIEHPYDNRVYMIKAYHMENQHRISNFVVIDDLDLSGAFGENFIYCKSDFEGIKLTGLKDKMINKLNKI